MPPSHGELQQRIFDAFNRRDLADFLTLMDADVRAVPLTAVMEGDYRGHDGIRRWWTNLLDILPDYTIDAIAVRELGDVTVSELRNRAHGPGSDTDVEHRTWSVAKWRDGKVVWWGNFQTEAEALDAVGQREP